MIDQLISADNYSLLLNRIADDLLSHQVEDDRLKAAAARLYSLCSTVTGIDEYSIHAAVADGTRLPSGEAISPKDAARCVLDFSRTSKFLKGIHAAILEAQRRFPDTVIEILYAGCGPFAPLAIPLTTRFGSAGIRFTLLDVHKRSLDAARSIFQVLGKSDFVRDYIQCDAATYKNAAPHAIHVVIVEAMQAALEREPQAAITMNLAPQLCPGGIFIPEKITVDCYLCDLTKEFTAFADEADAADSLASGVSGRVRINLGRVLELTAGGCRNLSASGNREQHAERFLTPKLLLNVPGDLDGELDLMLSTAVTVFDTIALDDYESGLTCPRILFDAGRRHGGRVIEFEYQPGDRPAFKYRFA